MVCTFLLEIYSFSFVGYVLISDSCKIKKVWLIFPKNVKKNVFQSWKMSRSPTRKLFEIKMSGLACCSRLYKAIALSHITQTTNEHIGPLNPSPMVLSSTFKRNRWLH